MPIKHIRLALFVVVACFGSANISYGAAPAASPLDPPKKVTKLDNLIRKVYLMAEDFFGNANTPEQGVPTKGIFIDAADEVASTAPKAGDVPMTQPQDEPKLDGPPVEPVLEAPVIGEEGDVEDKLKEVVPQGGVAGVLAKRNEELAREQARKQAKQQASGGISPLYWKKMHEEHRKKMEEARAARKEKEAAEKAAREITEIPETPKKEEETVPRNPEDIVPRKRPNENYRTELLPSAINKKEYNKENQHLPPAEYEDEYRKILFDSAAAGNLDVLRAMVERLGTTEIVDGAGNTPILYAIMAGNIKSVVALAGMDAGLDVKNGIGVSPLYAAIKASREDMVVILLRHQADPNIKCANDETPLMLAARNNEEQIAKILIKKGAKINERMKNGDTALHIAAEANSASVAYLLIINGADTEMRNFTGRTPLMVAAENGGSETAGVLLKAGVDTTKMDAQGRNAMKLASEKGFVDVAESIASEDVRRSLAAEKVIKVKAETAPPKDEVVLGQAEGSHRIKSKDEIPVPVKKPLVLKEVPQPKFSEEEKKAM
jgi:hypothetical protein